MNKIENFNPWTVGAEQTANKVLSNRLTLNVAKKLWSLDTMLRIQCDGYIIPLGDLLWSSLGGVGI